MATSEPASLKVVLALAVTPCALEPLGTAAQLAPSRPARFARLSLTTMGSGRPVPGGEGGRGSMLPMYPWVAEQLLPVGASGDGSGTVVDA
jgi:hypothetical protein